MDSPLVPSELLLDIFRRIHDPADLVRISAACISFRRIVDDRSFLRQYRKLHPPPLIGFLDRTKVFHRAIPPHPSASAASAVALAADFSFSFLPTPARNWVVRDIRDGRVLLDRRPQHDIENRHSLVFQEMVVCDPLHRLYLLLPPIPDNLASSPLILKERKQCEIFLAPHDDDEETAAAEETSFKVILMAQCQTKLSAFVFFSSTGQWQAVASQSWSVLFHGLLLWPCMDFFNRQYAYGCFYWVIDDDDLSEKLLVLDIRRLEFSMVDRPPRISIFSREDIAIVEAGEGITGMFDLTRRDLRYFIRQINVESSIQWQLEKTISLGSVYFYLVGSAGRHLFLNLAGCTSLDAGCFSLDIKTFQLERVFSSEFPIPAPRAYSNFPPSLLSTPKISIGVENRAEKEMLEQCCAASSSAQLPGSE